MKALVHRIYTDPRCAKIFHWVGLISVTGSAQVMIQAIGLACGILVIRLLPTHEYAVYTLANTMLGTMVILADGGITAGIMARGGRVWQDKQQLGVVLATGLDLRKKFAIGSTLVVVPVLFCLLRYQGTYWLMSTVIILSLIMAFYMSLAGNLLQVVPRLVQNTLPVQKIQVGASIARLTLSVLFLFIFPWAFVAILLQGFRKYGQISAY